MSTRGRRDTQGQRAARGDRVKARIASTDLMVEIGQEPVSHVLVFCDEHGVISEHGSYLDSEIDGYVAATLEACRSVNTHNGKAHPTVLAARRPWFAT